VPALLLVVALDAILLEYPREGWRRNWLYWARLALIDVMIATMILVQAQLVIPDVGLTARKALFTVVCTSARPTEFYLLLGFIMPRSRCSPKHR
jgi:hypothetical protein